MNYYYHLTQPEFVTTIQKEGLKPMLGKRSKSIGDKEERLCLCSESSIDAWSIMLGTNTVIKFLITGCIILCSHVEATKQISKNQFEYEAIIAEVQAVNSDNEDVSKVLVIKDVNEWNKEVHRQKYLASSPWTSWCYSQKVVDKMEYIEVPEWNVPTPDSNK